MKLGTVSKANEMTPLESAVQNVIERNYSRFRVPGILHALYRYLVKVSTVRTFSISVGTTANQVADVPNSPNRRYIRIFNLGGSTVYYSGRRNVTTGSAGDPSAGFPLLSNTGLTIDDYTGPYWFISGSAAQDVRIEEGTVESL